MGKCWFPAHFILFRTFDISDWLSLILDFAISFCTSRFVIRNIRFSYSDTAAKTALLGFPSLQALSVFQIWFVSVLDFKSFSDSADSLSEESGINEDSDPPDCWRLRWVTSVTGLVLGVLLAGVVGFELATCSARGVKSAVGVEILFSGPLLVDGVDKNNDAIFLFSVSW